MTLSKFAFSPLLLILPLLALAVPPAARASAEEDQANRAKLSGNWQSDGGQNAGWTLEEKGDSVHVVNTVGGQTVADFTCSTSGKECSVKHAGHSSKVSMWFNGPKLVVLETTGNQTVKQRFAVSGNGDVLELETIPVSAEGSPELSHFKRATTQTAAK